MIDGLAGLKSVYEKIERGRRRGLAPSLRGACPRSRRSGVENGDWLRVLEVPVPVLDAADAESRVAGNRERHLEDSEPVPAPSSYPFSYTLSDPFKVLCL